MIPLALPGGRFDPLAEPTRSALESKILPTYARDRRWYTGKARKLAAVRIVEAAADPASDSDLWLVLARFDYEDGGSDLYQLPLAVVPPPETEAPHVITRVEGMPAGDRVLIDALADPACSQALVRAIATRARWTTPGGSIRFESSPLLQTLTSGDPASLPAQLSTKEQSHSAVALGGKLLLKVFRRLDPGLNPDLELGRYLVEHSDFSHLPRIAGWVELACPSLSVEPTTLALLQEWIPNQGTGWEHALDLLEQAYAELAHEPDRLPPASAGNRPWLDLAAAKPPPDVVRMIGSYLPFASRLGRRTGQLHLAMAAADAQGLTPRPLTETDLRVLGQAVTHQVETSLAMLRTRLSDLPKSAAPAAREVLTGRPVLMELLDDLASAKPDGLKIRLHGDLHLGQVLIRDEEFVFLDFEGEPLRPLSERRELGLPLKDVVGMIRSFDYAANAALFRFCENRPELLPLLAPWGACWSTWISAAYLRAYLEATGSTPLLPSDFVLRTALLRAFTLDKALYELQYELNHRPDWVPIPLEGIQALIRRQSDDEADDLT